MSAHADAAQRGTAPPQPGCTHRQVLAVLSDQYGRKPLLLFAISGPGAGPAA